MKSLKGKRGFYISVGVLILVLAGSAFFYKKEAAKAKQMENEVKDVAANLDVIRGTTPTEEHKRSLQEQKIQIEDNYKRIIGELRQWESVPLTQETAAIFVGDLRTTVGMVATAAARKQILVDPKARNLGFDEFERVAPGPEEDIMQLQRELSAATDISMLLIGCDVYSIEFMSRRDDALMEEGQAGPGARMPGETTTTPPTRRRRSKLDMYDTVPFRVRFSCRYPSLAAFMKSLSSPGRLLVEEAERRVSRPKNFLVINDLRFRVKDTREEGAEVLRSSSADRMRSPMLFIIPEDMPQSLGTSLLARNTREALNTFSMWRTWQADEKKIFVLRERLREMIADEERQRLTAELSRLTRERDERVELQGKGRPPDYNTIVVTMLIDFIQFNDKLKAEVEPAKPRAKPTAPPTTGSQ